MHDPLLSQGRERNEEDRTILRCMTGYRYSDKDIEQVITNSVSFKILQSVCYIPTTEGGGHIAFGADPVGIRVGARVRVASFRYDIL